METFILKQFLLSAASPDLLFPNFFISDVEMVKSEYWTSRNNVEITRNVEDLRRKPNKSLNFDKLEEKLINWAQFLS